MPQLSPAQLVQQALSAFHAENEPLLAPTRALLGTIVADPDLHARFMNTLAMLEHLGSHKIMATQHGRNVPQETLKHLAEEARHAFFFKRQAEALARRPLGPSEMLAQAAARMYFQRLEGAIVQAIPQDAPADAIYLYTSMIVEFRAVWGYQLYQECLTAAGSSLSLKSLLAEESGHLSDMAERLAAGGMLTRDRLAGFCAAEERLFARLLVALERAVEREQAAGAAGGWSLALQTTRSLH